MQSWKEVLGSQDSVKARCEADNHGSEVKAVSREASGIEGGALWKGCVGLEFVVLDWHRRKVRKLVRLS